MSKVVDMNGNAVTSSEVDDVDEAAIEKLMAGQLKHEADLMLTIWRCYYLLRMSMLHKSQGKISPEVFQELSSALATVAAEEFDVGQLKRSVKKDLVGFLGGLADNQFNAIADEKMQAKAMKESTDGGV